MKMTLKDPLKEIDRKISDIFQENPPSVNMYEKEDKLYVQVQLPSFKEDEVDVVLTGEEIKVTAEHEIERDEQNSQYYMHEAKLEKQFRSISLPKDVDINTASAEMANGLLSICLPLKNTSDQVNVEVENAED